VSDDPFSRPLFNTNHPYSASTTATLKTESFFESMLGVTREHVLHVARQDNATAWMVYRTSQAAKAKRDTESLVEYKAAPSFELTLAEVDAVFFSEDATHERRQAALPNGGIVHPNEFRRLVESGVIDESGRILK